MTSKRRVVIGEPSADLAVAIDVFAQALLESKEHLSQQAIHRVHLPFQLRDATLQRSASIRLVRDLVLLNQVPKQSHNSFLYDGIDLRGHPPFWTADEQIYQRADKRQQDNDDHPGNLL